MAKIIINEFYRGTTLTTGDEFIELLLVEDLTAAQLDSFFVGDSTGTKLAKFSAYDFTGTSSITSSIAPIFKAGTIITIGGTTRFTTQDTSYNPTAGDWNITLNAGGSFLPNANAANTGDIAGDDIVWVDNNTGTTISTDGFAVDIGAVVAATLVPNVDFGASTNNTGYALNSNLAGATSIANWTTGIASGSTLLTPGAANGGANTTYIDSLRNTVAGPTVSIVATANAAEAGPANGTFRISRTGGDTTNALVVNYAVATGAGQATAGADYTTLPGTATIAAGNTFIDVIVTPIDDALPEAPENVTLTLTAPSGYGLGGGDSGSDDR
jgi:Calx-beta domain